MKKHRLAACFTPDTIAGQVAERMHVQDELGDIFLKLKRFDSSWILKNKVAINEDQALLLLASQISFYGVVNLKLALDHVPTSYSTTTTGTSTPIRFLFVADIMSKKGFHVTPSDAKTYSEFSERFCKNFLSSSIVLGELLWTLTAEKDCCYKKFISPHVESCLKCNESLTMHNQPSKAIVHGAAGPLPAIKITLECKDCKTTYGICHFSDENGRHFYPKDLQMPLIEASNVMYVERNFYKWMPSLGYILHSSTFI